MSGVIYNGELMTIEKLHEVASEAAREATDVYIAKHGEGAACGFAWVEVHGVKLSTKLGKALKAVGFRKGYPSGIHLWNPSKHHTQSVDAKYEGASAYAKILSEAGLKAFPADRLD